MTVRDPFAQSFDALRAAFDRAGRANEIEERFICPGGVPVRLLIIGDHFTGMIDTALTPTAPVDDPSITLYVFDSASSGVKVPAPPWTLDAYLARDELGGSGTHGIEGSCDVLRRVISLYDHQRREGIWWAADQTRLAPWDSAAPLRNVLHWALADHGLQLAHGAVVGIDDRGILLTARGGSGKSTTALALARNAWRYVADDYCLLTCRSPARAHRVYRVAKADAESLARFADLDSAVINPDRDPGDKAIIDLSATSTDLADHLDLVGVVVPHLDGKVDAARVTRADAGAAARALVPSTLLQLPGGNDATIRRLADAIRGLACCDLALPTGLDSVPDVLGDLLDSLATTDESSRSPRPPTSPQNGSR